MGRGYVAYTFAGADGPVLALADDEEFGDTWSVGRGVRLRLAAPPGVREVTAVDLLGNAKMRQLGNDSAGRLVLTACELLGGAQDVAVDVESGAHRPVHEGGGK